VKKQILKEGRTVDDLSKPMQ
jgi:hypothetical protein